MKLIWLGYILEIGILALLKPFILDFNSVAIVAVTIHSLFTLVFLFFLKNKSSLILVSAFLIRVLFLVWDLYGRKIFVLPNSGSDSEMFYGSAILISENLTLLRDTRGGFYSDINGLLFHLIGPQRMFAQYMNVLLGISMIFVIYKTLSLLNIDNYIKNIIITIIAFFPNSIIMSAVFIREVIPAFFVSLSLYYFIKWFKENKLKYMTSSFILIGIASMFHSGVIGVILGYTFTFLFYKKETNEFKFSSQTIISFILIFIVFFLAFNVLDSYIFGKFQDIDEISDIYRTATPNGLGGSAYLANVKINNLPQLMIYGPIKSVYFLSSPLPMDWRGLLDVFTFFTDAFLYFGTIFYFIKNRKYLGNKKVLAISILLMIIGATFIFGIGVSNTGTAVRHRQKIISLFLVLLGIIMDEKRLYGKNI